VTVVVVTSDGGRPSTVVSESGRSSTMGDQQCDGDSGGGSRSGSVSVNGGGAATTTIARLKRFKIQTHCFSTLDEICWVAF